MKKKEFLKDVWKNLLSSLSIRGLHCFKRSKKQRNYFIHKRRNKHINIIENMERPELFNKSVDILVKAFQDDVLEYTDCHACAVGNLCAAAVGNKLFKKDGIIKYEGRIDHSRWSQAIFFGEGMINTYIDEETLNLMELTSYTPLELAIIEKAFWEGTNELHMKCLKGKATKEEENFSGLMSVVDVLMKIHKCEEKSVEKETKEKFVLLEECV